MGACILVPSRGRVSYCTWPIPPPGKNVTFSCILQTEHFSLACVTPAPTACGLLALSGPGTEKGSSAGPGCSATGPYVPTDPMVLEISAAERDAVWSLLQVPVGGTQNRPLGFWSKAIAELFLGLPPAPK